MKAFLLFFIILLSPTLTFSRDVSADSLKTLFVNAKTQHERTVNCLNLDNYYRNILRIDSLPLTRILLEEGIKERNEYVISDALRKLVMGVNRKNRVLTNDSVIYYLKIAEENLSGERKRSFFTEVRLRHIRSKADWATDESQVIEELTSLYNNPNENENDIYYQIERNYALGMAGALSISDSSIDTYVNTQRYIDRLFELIQQLPIEYGAEILFWVNENIYISYINSKHSEKAILFLEKMMDMLNEYKKLPDVKADVYQTFEYTYSFYNEGIAYFPSIVGYNKAFDCLKKANTMLRNRGDLMNVYFIHKGFYDDLKDHKNIIAYADSIIVFMKTYDAPVAEAVISSMYKDQSVCYAALNDYKRAYELMQEHDMLQKKITNEDSKKLRADMDARYDLSHLELEKERLTSRNRQIALFSILIVFVLSIAWGFSQRYNVNKLKKTQKKLIESNKEVVRQSEKAQESEKMKTAFINSICHEIRTPLNAINGFSGLLLNESIDVESKKEFPGIIKMNTDMLTRLLDNMLEVSNLSSSMEELPSEQANMVTICTQEMEKLKSIERKDNIEYRLEIADDCHEIHTNVFYLSQTIAHLLVNANKFTQSGHITLGCSNNSEGKLELRVTDTGIGIPLDKQEWVFERFTKLDEFKSGTGLGLYICQLIVKRLDGTIRIDSTYKEGTSFVITL